jgi:plastocyanin domain-containing protein
MSDTLARLVAVLFTLFATSCGSAAATPPSDGRPEIAIHVGATGYDPARATAAAGSPVRLVFTRTSDEGCGQQVVFPDLHITRDLPLGEPVAIDVTMPASGAISFTCGMSMYRGSVVAR